MLADQRLPVAREVGLLLGCGWNWAVKLAWAMPFRAARAMPSVQ